MDSVPNGGWLDGCLNVLAGLEVLRRIAANHTASRRSRCGSCDWADEEGARFGRSLFGSSACSGTLDLDEARELVDKDGVRLPDALAQVAWTSRG
jgi:N-carbamoyl-L-amino-acid hydrolase